jgi:ABC-type antimicrobial peptide transport system permease subunit
MKIADMFRLALKALVDRKLRSVLTLLGIAVGSAILMALIASTSGLTVGVQSQIQKTGANVLTVRTAGGFFASGSTSTFQLSQDDVTYLKSLEGVAAVYPYNSYGAAINIGGSSIQATLVGIDLNALPVLYQGLTLAEGSMPSLGETTSAAVGWGISNPVSGTPLQLNQMISMTISGIKGAKSPVSYAVLAKAFLASYGTALSANIDDSVFIPMQAVQFVSKSPYFTGIYVICNTADDVANVENEIQTYYSNNVRIISPGQILSSLQGISQQLTVFLGSIGAVSLFVATVGIVNTMYVSVMERTREIGILKAIGYRPKQIMGMFLSEAALTGVIGGFVGLALGFVLSFAIGGQLGGGLIGGRGFGGGFGGGGGGSTIHPVFTTGLIVFSLVLPIGLSVVAGLYPAWRASKMNAVVALKYE